MHYYHLKFLHHYNISYNILFAALTDSFLHHYNVYILQFIHFALLKYIIQYIAATSDYFLHSNILFFIFGLVNVFICCALYCLPVFICCACVLYALVSIPLYVC